MSPLLQELERAILNLKELLEARTRERDEAQTQITNLLAMMDTNTNIAKQEPAQEPERQWVWYAGYHEESYQVGPCDTRDDVIDEAISEQVFNKVEPDKDHPDGQIGIYVVEATKHRLEDIKIDGQVILETLSEFHYEDWLDPDSDNGLFTTTTEQEKDLSDRLTKTLHQWSRDHNLPPNAYMFRDQRNEEYVVLTVHKKSGFE